MSHEDLKRRLRTVQLVPITAFDSEGRLNLEPMRELAKRTYAAGIRTFIPCAGSAEFHALSADEIVSTVAMMRDAVGDDAVIVAPLGLQPDWAISLGRRAIEAGADVLLVMPLTFPYLSNAGARDYYTALFTAVDAPFQVYKKSEIPSDDLLLDLAVHPNLVGVKYAVNDMDAFRSIVLNDDGRIEWYCGSAERYAPYYMLAGATGYTSGAGSLCPRLTLSMHAALSSGNWAEAMRLQGIINPIEHYRGRDANSYNVSFLKYAVRHIGLDFGETRPPSVA